MEQAPDSFAAVDYKDFAQVSFDYAYLRSVGNAMGETRDCAVIALAVVTGEGYPKIHEMLRKAGRRARCGTQWNHSRLVLKQLNLQAQEITHFYEGASIRSIAPQLPDRGNFLIRTHKHLAAVKDGVIQDWSEEKKLYVQGIYKVTDIEDTMAMPEKRRRQVVIGFEKPTKAVWTIADILFEDELDPKLNSRGWWSTFRAKVIAECEINGINKTTAAVQIGKWMAEQGYVMGYMV